MCVPALSPVFQISWNNGVVAGLSPNRFVPGRWQRDILYVILHWTGIAAKIDRDARDADKKDRRRWEEDQRKLTRESRLSWELLVTRP